MYLCRQLNLDFTETKKQILTEVWSRDLYLHLCARKHITEENFLDDLADLEGANVTRRPVKEKVDERAEKS